MVERAIRSQNQTRGPRQLAEPDWESGGEPEWRAARESGH